MNAAVSGSTARVQNRLAIPADLSAWAEKPVLLQWVVEEIDTLDWTNSELVQFLRANPKFQPRFILVLMIYCYATGRFDSEDVVEVYFAEGNLKSLFPGQVPAAATLKRFRRDHRGLLRWGLSQVLKRALRHRFELGETAAIPAGLNRQMVEVATNRLD